MTVMKINVMAAGRDFMGKIANCRGGRVGRKIEMTQAVVAAVCQPPKQMTALGTSASTTNVAKL